MVRCILDINIRVQYDLLAECTPQIKEFTPFLILNNGYTMNSEAYFNQIDFVCTFSP